MRILQRNDIIKDLRLKGEYMEFIKTVLAYVGLVTFGLMLTFALAYVGVSLGMFIS